MRIAITGTIAAGKSTVAILLRRRGLPVFNADQYAKRALYKGTSCHHEIVALFGKSVLAESGDIDRKKLADIVFRDNSKRVPLNHIVHPFVLSGMQKFFENQKDQPLLFAEVPLLYEAGWQNYFDYVVVVTCSKQEAVKRMVEDRGYSKEEALSRMSAQLDSQAQISKADKVIYNEGSIRDLDKEINQWIGNIRKEIRNGKNAAAHISG